MQHHTHAYTPFPATVFGKVRSDLVQRSIWPILGSIHFNRTSSEFQSTIKVQSEPSPKTNNDFKKRGGGGRHGSAGRPRRTLYPATPAPDFVGHISSQFSMGAGSHFLVHIIQFNVQFTSKFNSNQPSPTHSKQAKPKSSCKPWKRRHVDRQKNTLPL